MKGSNLIGSLMRIYAVVMISIITLFTFLVGYDTFRRTVEEAEKTNLETARAMVQKVNNLEKEASRITNDLVGSREDIQNLYDYFNLDHAAYLEKTLSNSIDKEQRYWPRMIDQLYLNQEGVAGIGVTLNSYTDVFYSNKDKKGGELMKKMPKIDNQLMVSKVIKDPDSYENLGVFFLVADSQNLLDLFEMQSGSENQMLYISSQTNQIMFQHQGSRTVAKKDYLPKIEEDLQKHGAVRNPTFLKNYYTTSLESQGGQAVVVLTPKKNIYLKAFESYFVVLVGSLILDCILLVILFRTFGGYGKQVEDILESMYLVADGNLDVRIDEESKKREIKELSYGINQMLDSVEQYVKDIYLLEIEQQDAHMRALQSQINPHFLYNTLEYIRMYAVSEGVDELADVVYTFASLLRNNTTQEKAVPLQQELDFCEKYVYLYQMRYPDRIAYKFTIDPSVEEIKVPKFIIQPVIENYFVHGIDFNRTDNAISVKVYRQGHQIVLEVIDNGKGMDEAKLEEINRQLQENRQVSQQASSIGLQNVNERLQLYFGGSSQMYLRHNGIGGLVVRMLFEEGESHV